MRRRQQQQLVRYEKVRFPRSLAALSSSKVNWKPKTGPCNYSANWYMQVQRISIASAAAWPKNRCVSLPTFDVIFIRVCLIWSLVVFSAIFRLPLVRGGGVCYTCLHGLYLSGHCVASTASRSIFGIHTVIIIIPPFICLTHIWTTNKVKGVGTRFPIFSILFCINKRKESEIVLSHRGFLGGVENAQKSRRRHWHAAWQQARKSENKRSW